MDKKKIQIIEFRCKKCNRRIMDYMVQEDDNAIVMQGIMIKCDRCKRVINLKKYTQRMIFDNMIMNFIKV